MPTMDPSSLWYGRATETVQGMDAHNDIRHSIHIDSSCTGNTCHTVHNCDLSMIKLYFTTIITATSTSSPHITQLNT